MVPLMENVADCEALEPEYSRLVKQVPDLPEVSHAIDPLIPPDQDVDPL